MKANRFLVMVGLLFTLFFCFLTLSSSLSFSRSQDEKNQEDKNENGSVEGIVLDVYVLPDADEAFMNKLGEILKKSSKSLWKLGEGNFYLKEVRISDKADKKAAWKKGTVIIDSIDKGLTKCPDGSTDYGYTQIGYGPMVLPGKFAIGTFLHEFGHLQFDIRDEYGRRKKCKGCLMALPIGGHFCDSTNHSSDGSDCWSSILKRYPKFKHPNKDFKESPPAETKVTITNN